MKLSIIINNYNYDQYLARSIQSALDQDYRDVEVLVVDDGSTDSSRDVLTRYRDRVLVIEKENGGQASAFNAGFRACSGDAILFLDADDLLHPECACVTTTRLTNEHAGATAAKLHFRLACIGADDEPLGMTKPHERYQLASGTDVWKDIIETGEYVSVPTSGNVFSRQFLSEVMPMPEPTYRICADNYLNHLAPFYGPIIAENRSLGGYRIHGNNSSHNRRNVSKERANEILNLLQLTEDCVKRRAKELGISTPSHIFIDRTYRSITMSYLAGRSSLPRTLANLFSVRGHSKLRNSTEIARFMVRQLSKAFSSN